MRRKNNIIKLTFLILCLSPIDLYAQNQNQASDNKKLENVLVGIVESVANQKQNNKSAKNKTPDQDGFSLMYDKEQERKIWEAYEASKNKAPLVEAGPTEIVEEDLPKDSIISYIYLGSILYRSKDDWTVWINDQKISSRDNKRENELYIKKIDAEKADISWTMSISKWKILTGNRFTENAPLNANNQVEFNFILSFNQTYILNTNEVVEGKISPSVTKNEDQTQPITP